ncbi:MAG: hypothetical protein J5710_01165 [Treponema sp.]|nr:hypothetical protein [Treponema sp.]
MGKRITVTKETSTGRNLTFHDNYKNKDMSRREFVKEIKNGEYNKYHTRIINGIETPVSNPDKSTSNNLG